MPRHDRSTPATRPHVCTQASDSHRHSQMYAGITRVHTPPSSPTPARMLTHHFPLPHPTHSWSVQKHPSLRCIHTDARAATCKRSLPSPPSPHAHSLVPREPAPALLSTRDWPTRIRMLDARMDRQKLSKMMERSDFINLRGQRTETEELAVPAQPGRTGHLPAHPPSLPPTSRRQRRWPAG